VARIRGIEFREIVQLLVVSWLARGVFIVAMPSDVRSRDVGHWIKVAAELRRGANPYETTTYLNWPPLWLGCIWLIDRVARGVGISFFLALRLFLITAESGVIVAVYLLLRSFGERRARLLVLVGICLNPVAILLVCQHGNFDVLVGLAVVVGVACLLHGGDRGWLGACAAFGIGALTKTVPVVLAPLLAADSAFRPRRVIGLGVLVFAGPVVVGVAVLLVLAPHAVVDNVLLYRSSSGTFGITGLLTNAGLDGVADAYSRRVFPVVAVLLIAGGCVFLWRRELSARQIVLAPGLALLAIPTLGAGYAPQYAYWWLPLLLLSYPLFDATWRRALEVLYVVAAVTYVVEYALILPQGAFLQRLYPHSVRITKWSLDLGQADWQTLVRLPLFAGAFVVLAIGAVRVAASLESGSSTCAEKCRR
jgi:hypothetical protein